MCVLEPVINAQAEELTAAVAVATVVKGHKLKAMAGSEVPQVCHLAPV